MNSPLERSEQELVNECLRVMLARGAFVFGRFSTTVKGIADVIGVLPGGRFVAVECKRLGETVTPAQGDFLDAIKRRGGLAVVITDVADLAEILDRELRRPAA